ncbi:MAG: ThiF family adenylyltransferase [Candidatus Bathyarchaeia archaeon]
MNASLPSYKQIEVELNPNKTAKDLKGIICKKLGIEPELTRLLAHGKPLPDRTRLSRIRETVTIDYLWARHLLLWGLEGQRRIRDSSVLLAGAGAIGNEVAKNLAMLGVGRIIIVDRDTVEMSNVSRMVFFEKSDLGKNKAEVLAKKIHRKYPFVQTIAFRGALERLPLKFYLDSNVIVCGLDNVVSRIFLTQICRKYSVPLVDGGITGMNGRIHVYLPPNDACPVCIFPPNQYSKIVGLRNPCDAPLEQEAVPSFSTTISLVSSILAQETIKLIIGMEEYRSNARWPESSGQPLRSVLFLDLRNNRYTPMDLKRGEKCLVCGKEGTTREPAQRGDLMISTVSRSKGNLAENIRRDAKIDGKVLRILLETSEGTRLLDGHSKRGKSVGRGDYLRVLVDGKDEEFHESILRLT